MKGAMQFGGRRLVVSKRGLAVSNLQIGYLTGAHRLEGTYRISSQLQRTPAKSTIMMTNSKFGEPG
jgi:hypothetical protein